MHSPRSPVSCASERSPWCSEARRRVDDDVWVGEPAVRAGRVPAKGDAVTLPDGGGGCAWIVEIDHGLGVAVLGALRPTSTFEPSASADPDLGMWAIARHCPPGAPASLVVVRSPPYLSALTDTLCYDVSRTVDGATSVAARDDLRPVWATLTRLRWAGDGWTLPNGGASPQRRPRTVLTPPLVTASPTPVAASSQPEAPPAPVRAAPAPAVEPHPLSPRWLDELPQGRERELRIAERLSSALAQIECSLPQPPPTASLAVRQLFRECTTDDLLVIKVRQEGVEWPEWPKVALAVQTAAQLTFPPVLDVQEAALQRALEDGMQVLVPVHASGAGNSRDRVALTSLATSAESRKRLEELLRADGTELVGSPLRGAGARRAILSQWPDGHTLTELRAASTGADLPRLAAEMRRRHFKQSTRLVDSLLLSVFLASPESCPVQAAFPPSLREALWSPCSGDDWTATEAALSALASVPLDWDALQERSRDRVLWRVTREAAAARWLLSPGDEVALGRGPLTATVSRRAAEAALLSPQDALVRITGAEQGLPLRLVAEVDGSDAVLLPASRYRLSAEAEGGVLCVTVLSEPSVAPFVDAVRCDLDTVEAALQAQAPPPEPSSSSCRCATQLRVLSEEVARWRAEAECRAREEPREDTSPAPTSPRKQAQRPAPLPLSTAPGSFDSVLQAATAAIASVDSKELPAPAEDQRAAEVPGDLHAVIAGSFLAAIEREDATAAEAALATVGTQEVWDMVQAVYDSRSGGAVADGSLRTDLTKLCPAAPSSLRSRGVSWSPQAHQDTDTFSVQGVRVVGSEATGPDRTTGFTLAVSSGEGSSPARRRLRRTWKDFLDLRAACRRVGFDAAFPRPQSTVCPGQLVDTCADPRVSGLEAFLQQMVAAARIQGGGELAPLLSEFLAGGVDDRVQKEPVSRRALAASLAPARPPATPPTTTSLSRAPVVPPAKSVVDDSAADLDAPQRRERGSSTRTAAAVAVLPPTPSSRQPPATPSHQHPPATPLSRAAAAAAAAADEAEAFLTWRSAASVPEVPELRLTRPRGGAVVSPPPSLPSPTAAHLATTWTSDTRPRGSAVAAVASADADSTESDAAAQTLRTAGTSEHTHEDLRPGMEVLGQGLVSKPELNGVKGIVRGFVRRHGALRVKVSFEPTGKRKKRRNVSVAPENLSTQTVPQAPFQTK